MFLRHKYNNKWFLNKKYSITWDLEEIMNIKLELFDKTSQNWESH